MVLSCKTICECSKPIFPILVYYIINCFTLVFNGFNCKPCLKQAMSFKANNGCECSKTIFLILVYYYYKLFYTGI